MSKGNTQEQSHKGGTRDSVLRFLEESSGEPVSGGAIARALGVSRTAVWKAIRQLEEEGYKIDAASGKGYTLRRDNDIVSPAGILKYLSEECKTALHLEAGPAAPGFLIREETGSTNELLKEEAMKGAPEGSLAVALSQTGGKGRRGRSFYSPQGTGIYFSLLLRPMEGGRERGKADGSAGAVDPGRITTMAAVAAAEAIRRCGVEDVGIKWVNDVYVRGRKVCGILAEASTDLETGDIGEVVLGVGLNLLTPPGGFPAEIARRAGSIFEEEAPEDMRNRLVAYTYEAFFDLYRRAAYEEVTERYRSLCFVPGRKIDVIRGGEERPALALSLDEDCHLVVRYEDGSEETLFSGEISIRV